MGSHSRAVRYFARCRLNVRQEINEVASTKLLASRVLLPIRSVVLWATSTYAYPIVLRLVSSEDGMTADWARSLRLVGSYFQPYCQRSSRRQPGGLRYYV